MLAQIPGAAYVARVSVHNPKAVRLAKQAIKKGFEYQMAGIGLSLIEVLSTCPTGWGLSPIDALRWLEENMIPYYPLGVYKSPEEA
jgi:2-oxoglutarate ferredoxin oxidoreductase subunit beta